MKTNIHTPQNINKHRRFRTLYGFLIVLLTLIGYMPIHAANWYVAPYGSDGNSGTSTNSPWKTISYGVGMISPGDTLWVLSGTYVETPYVTASGTAANPIIIAAYNAGNPIIDGEGTLPNQDYGSLLTLVGNNIQVFGFEVRNCNTNGTYIGGYGVQITGTNDLVAYMNVHNCWANGILANGDFSTVANSYVWENCQSNDNLTHTNNWGSGLSAARDIVNGITDHAQLINNVVHNNWGEGLSTYEAEGTIIEGNVVYDNYSVNLYISDADNVIADGNLVYNSSTPNDPTCETIALADENSSVARSTNNIIINNFIYGNPFSAFSWTIVTNSGLNNVLIADNTFVDAVLSIGDNLNVHNKSATIENNIFLTDTGTPWDTVGSLANLTFSHNLWSQKPPSGMSGGNTDVIGNPRLARTGSTNAGALSPAYFKILSNSPGIGKAAVLSAVPTDFFGTARGSSPDMGGDQY